MSTADSIRKMEEQLKYLPRYFDELRNDILRWAETFQNELEEEKKSAASWRRSRMSSQLGLRSWRAELPRASRIQDRSSADRGLLRYLD